MLAHLVRLLGLGLIVLSALPATCFAESALAPALSWVREDGAETCVSGPDLAVSLEQQLGRSLLVALPRAQLTIEGSIAPAPRGFAAQFRVTDRNGVMHGARSLVATVDECRKLDALLVFVLTLLVDPDAPLLPPELPPGMSVETDSTLAELFGTEPTVPPLSLAAPSAATPPASPTPRNTPARRDPIAPRDETTTDGWHARANLDALGAVGLLPKLGSGLRLTVEASPMPVLRFELGGALFLENAVAANSATFSALLVELATCYRTVEFSRDFLLWTCAGGSFGPLRTRVATDAARNPRRTIAQLGAGPAFEWKFSEIVSLRVGLTASFPLLRDTFYLSTENSRTQVFRMSPVIGSASVGLSAAIL